MEIWEEGVETRIYVNSNLLTTGNLSGKNIKAFFRVGFTLGSGKELSELVITGSGINPSLESQIHDTIISSVQGVVSDWTDFKSLKDSI